MNNFFFAYFFKCTTGLYLLVKSTIFYVDVCKKGTEM